MQRVIIDTHHLPTAGPDNDDLIPSISIEVGVGEIRSTVQYV
jgi:hypothetical protein